MRELPEPENAGDAKALADIAEHGWHVLKVSAFGESPEWAYSLGLFHNFGHPEIAIFGLPLDRMHAIVNVIGDLIRSGVRLPDDSSSTDVLEGYACEFRGIRKVWYAPFFGRAMWLYRGSDFPMVQCLWPDRDGHSPRASACSSAIQALQPLLEFDSQEEAHASEFLTWTKRDA